MSNTTVTLALTPAQVALLREALVTYRVTASKTQRLTTDEVHDFAELEGRLTHAGKLLKPDPIDVIAADEDCGERPECPVEFLDDGSVIWRVVPGSRVWLEGLPGIVVTAEAVDMQSGSLVRTRSKDGNERWIHWTLLRRTAEREAHRG